MRKVMICLLSWVWFKVLIIDWLLDMLIKIFSVIHKSFKELDNWIEIKYNELKKQPGEPDSRKV